MTARRKDIRRVLGLKGLAVALLVMGACAAHAEPLAPAQPPTIAALSAEAVQTLLKTHCASCHGATPEAVGAVAFALEPDVSAIAADLSLVVPGEPDASRLYQRLLGGHSTRPEAATAWPSAVEIAGVREWITGLPRRAGLCDEASSVAARDGSLIEAWRAGPGEGRAVGFVSLDHLAVSCQSTAELAATRSAVETLLGALALRSSPSPVETLGDSNTLLVVDLAMAGIGSGQWTEIEREAPTLAAGAVPADWLAALLLGDSDASERARDDRDLGLDAGGLEQVQRLARGWMSDVDLVRASAERGRSLQDVRKALASIEDEEVKPFARQLIRGQISRSAWAKVVAALDGAATYTEWLGRDAGRPLSLDLWVEPGSIKVGDEIALKVRASKACHLTLVSIDGEGKAMVLYPNDIDAENLIGPGVIATVPSPTAGYRFKADRAGRDAFVAVCQRVRARLEGVDVDYEKQRFSYLGDWRGFLLEQAEREKKIAEKDKPRERSRRRRGRDREVPDQAAPVAGVIDPHGPAIEGRAHLVIEVEAAPPQ